MQDQDQTRLGNRLIGVLVTVAAITSAGRLLGRYNASSGALTDLKVTTDDGHTIPPNTDLTTYKFIGTSDDQPRGQPLDDFVNENCVGWDGVTPLMLSFDHQDGEFVKWAHSATPIAAAAS